MYIATMTGFGPFCVIVVRSRPVFFYRHVWWFVLWLQVATITGFGPLCVFSIGSHPGFFLQAFLLVCSVAAGVHHDWVWPLLCFINHKQIRCFSTAMFVGLFCGCRWPP